MRPKVTFRIVNRPRYERLKLKKKVLRKTNFSFEFHIETAQLWFLKSGITYKKKGGWKVSRQERNFFRSRLNSKNRKFCPWLLKIAVFWKLESTKWAYVRTDM